MLTMVLNCDYMVGKSLKPLNTTHICPRQIGSFLLSFFGRERANKLNKHSPFVSDVSSSRSPMADRYIETKDTKMNNLITYTFKNNEIRTNIRDNEVWFCLKDCCQSLEIQDHIKVLERLNPNGVGKTHLTDKIGREQEAIFINESNLYKLIFRSNKPAARLFEEWVTSEVLPSIRKTGKYVSDVFIPEPPAVQPVIEFQQSPEAMKAVGGMIKKCCKTAVREVFTNDNETAMNALNIIINRIAEERCRGMYQAWREAAIRNIQNSI